MFVILDSHREIYIKKKLRIKTMKAAGNMVHTCNQWTCGAEAGEPLAGGGHMLYIVSDRQTRVTGRTLSQDPNQKDMNVMWIFSDVLYVNLVKRK